MIRKSFNANSAMSMWSRPIMRTDARRKITRTAVRTVIIHTAFVLVMVVSKNALWGTGAPWWKIEKVFRLTELPVLWAVDRLLQKMPLIPPWAAFERMWVPTSVSEFIAYGVFGGAFYALVAAAIAYARQRRRAATAEE
jgi:hypothetical protein